MRRWAALGFTPGMTNDYANDQLFWPNIVAQVQSSGLEPSMIELVRTRASRRSVSPDAAKRLPSEAV
jgi:hypothetical protein